MAIILTDKPEWADRTYREPRANWSYEDETQRCIIVEIGDLELTRRPRVATVDLLNRARVAITMRGILANLIPVGQVWVGQEIVIRFDEFESAIIKQKYFRDDIYTRALLVDILYELAMKGPDDEN